MADNNFSDPARSGQTPDDTEGPVGKGDYFMSPDQPPNQPTDPTGQTYIGMRVKLDHKYLRKLEELLEDAPDYCIYEHKRDTSNEHFHICLPGSIDVNRIEKYRKRIRTKFGGGNGVLSCKGYTNGLSSFVFYCSHEGTQAKYKDPMWDAIIKERLEKGTYVKQQYGHGDIKQYCAQTDNDQKSWAKDRAWVLTYSNVVNVALRYHYKFKTEPTLVSTLKHMVRHSKWRPARDLNKNGLDLQLVRDFEYQLGRRSDPDYSWIRVFGPQ